jgi:fibronectin type 3 domain-containing protein
VQQLQQSVEFLTAELTASRDNLLRAENAARVTSEEKVDVAELESVQRAAQESVAVAKAEFAQKLERTKAAEATKAASKVALETARVQSETRDQVQRFNSEKEEETASLRAKLASMTDRILSKEAELKVGLCTSFECSWPIALETAWSQPSSL